MDYSTTALLASIRRRASLPSASSTGTADSDLLAMANEVLQSYLVPLILREHEEYLVTSSDIALTASKAWYRLPSRAVGQKLREVHLLDSSGNVYNLAQTDLEHLQEFSASDRPQAFYIRGNQLWLAPAPSTSVDSLRLYWFRRPSELVLASSARTIVSVTANTPSAGLSRVVLSSAVPSGFTGTVTYDLVQTKPGFEVMAADLAPNSNPSGTSNIDFTTTALPSDFSTANNAGDYVCLADQSPLPNVPAEFHPLLAQRTAAKMLESGGYFEDAQLAMKVAAEIEASAIATIAPRVDGEPRKIIGGVLRGARGFRRSAFYGVQ